MDFNIQEEVSDALNAAIKELEKRVQK